MVGLIKTVNKADEAKYVFEVKLKNKYKYEDLVQNERSLVTVLGELIRKEKTFNLESSSHLSNHSKAVVEQHTVTQKKL